MSAQGLDDLAFEVIKSCGKISETGANRHVTALGVKSVQLALSAMQQGSPRIVEESIGALKKIMEGLHSWSSKLATAQGRKSGMKKEVDQWHQELDYIIERIERITSDSPDESENSESEDPLAGPTPVQGEDKVPLVTLFTLASILSTPEKRTALENLKDERAQSVINFLHQLLSESPNPSMPWLRKHSLLALRKLCGSSMLYPSLYVLKDITDSRPRRGGSFGDIYSAKQGSLELCLKVARSVGNEVENILKLYAKEAIVWGQLRHPNIVRFYGIFYLDAAKEKICLVSPWMENSNVEAYLKDNPNAPRKPLVRDVALGLEYLHNENIIHGDLKGVNILVDQLGRACIADFGSSAIRVDRTVGFTYATASSRGYTECWASPELLEDDAHPTQASDIWAFGCVCYEILSRRLPFHSIKNKRQIAIAITGGTKPATREKDPLPVDPNDRIDDGMWKLMGWCWSRDPKARPTCREILGELERQGVGQRDDETDHATVPETIVGVNTAEINLSEVQDILDEIDDTIRSNGGDSEVNTFSLWKKMSKIFQSREMLNALLSLEGDQAQTMIEYLHSIVSQQLPGISWFQEGSCVALYELAGASLLYPRSYVLKGITFGSRETGGVFSDIYRGHHRDQDLCLKVVRSFSKSETKAMLKRHVKEAILWRQLRHPNIVPFYGICYRDEYLGQICLVSPRMAGGDIVDYLRSASVPRTPFIYDIVAGLDYLHNRNIIHGNLKGMNVLVNSSARACLTDFGFSLVVTDRTLAYADNASNTHVFSERWASPELLEDASVTRASDIWALGCVCYEVLTGKLPFHDIKQHMRVLLALMKGTPPARLTVAGPDLTENVIWRFVERCWDLQPDARPECREILECLRTEGLARESAEEGQDPDRHKFWDTMRDEQVLVDPNAVEIILNKIYTSAGS